MSSLVHQSTSSLVLNQCSCLHYEEKFNGFITGNWKQWKWKPEMENGRQKWSKLDVNESYGKTFD